MTPISTQRSNRSLIQRALLIVIATVSLVVRSQIAYAAAGGIPGKPTPPPPPCISTGTLASDYNLFCSVHNVGIVAHTVTLEFRLIDNTTLGANNYALLPGQSIYIIQGTAAVESCVATSSEGTVDALQDLAVVEQALPNPSISPNTTAATDGKIFNSCAPPTTRPPS